MFSKNTKALIYTHLFGNMTDTKEIVKFCKDNGIVLIEDAAQSLGSSLNGTKAGTIGDSSSFSFNTNKVIAGINGGGMYLTDNDEHAQNVRKLRRHGKDKDFEFLGFNSRMYVLNAEIINQRFDNIVKHQNIRQEIAAVYNRSFSKLPIYTQEMFEGLNHNYHKYVIRLQDKETRKKIANKLSASIHYETTLSKNSMYQNIYYRKDQCVNSRRASDTVLSLPIHAWLTDEEINTIVETVKTIFE